MDQRRYIPFGLALGVLLTVDSRADYVMPPFPTVINEATAIVDATVIGHAGHGSIRIAINEVLKGSDVPSVITSAWLTCLGTDLSRSLRVGQRYLLLLHETSLYEEGTFYEIRSGTSGTECNCWDGFERRWMPLSEFGRLMADPTAGTPLHDVSVRKTREVEITWTGGRPPYVIVRSDAREFRDGVAMQWFLVDGPDRAFVDGTFGGDSQRHYYRVYSRDDAPRLFSMQPSDPAPRDVVKLQGFGFGFGTECAQNRIILGPLLQARVTSCSYTSLEFVIPDATGVGTIAIYTPNGYCEIGNRDDHGSCFQHKPAVTW